MIENKTAFLIIILSLFILSNTGYIRGETKSLTNDPFSQTKFMPGISFILDFSYVNRNIENEIYEALEIPGIGSIQPHGNEKKGFNFNYGELVLSSSVDPYFDLLAVFHISQEKFEVEEAYASTRRLPFGFKAKFGKFKSGFGRINEQHAHSWNFSDAPLIYRALFGEEGFQELGIQLKWVVPTPFFLSLGVESLQGQNESSFGTHGFDLIDLETQDELKIKSTPLPNAWTFFGKTSIDIQNWVILAGASCVVGKNRSESSENQETTSFNAGNTRIFGIDFTTKYIIDSYRYISFQAEYLHRKMNGTRYNTANISEEIPGNVVTPISFDRNQSGGYAQLVYRFQRFWRIGANWDYLCRNREYIESFENINPEKLNRYSFMVDYNPTEFSRIRIQYTIDNASYLDGQRKNYHGFSMQFNLAIGAHGAHAF